MSVAAEVGITFARELRRNLRSSKGIVSALLYLLGGAGALLIYVSVNNELARYGDMPQSARDELRRRVLASLYDDPNTVAHLVRAPMLLHFLYTATLFFLPVLCMLVGYDQLAGDLQYRTIRYATVRSRRESLVIGKTLGVWASGSILAFALHLFAWILTIARGDAPAALTLQFGLQFWLASVVFAAAFVGLTAVLSSAFRTPILALLTTFAASFGWWLLRHIVQFPTLKPGGGWLAYLTPGEWESRLLSPDVVTFAIGAAVLLAFGVVLTAGACLVMRSRDV